MKKEDNLLKEAFFNVNITNVKCGIKHLINDTGLKDRNFWLGALVGIEMLSYYLAQDQCAGASITAQQDVTRIIVRKLVEID